MGAWSAAGSGGRRDTAAYLAVIGRSSRDRDVRTALACAFTANKRPISARFAADWRLVAAWARRDPNSPLVFHRNGIAIRRWRTACRLSGATQRCLKPGCSKRIGNSRRTGRCKGSSATNTMSRQSCRPARFSTSSVDTTTRKATAPIRIRRTGPATAAARSTRWDLRGSGGTT